MPEFIRIAYWHGFSYCSFSSTFVIMRAAIFFFAGFICFAGSALAKGNGYSYTVKCSQAYSRFMSLHLSEGNAIIKQAIAEDYTNPMTIYVADYEDCLLLLFNGDKQDYEQRKGHLDARISLIDKGDASQPWHRLCKAGIYLHWALVNVRMGDNYRAALNFRKSFVLLKENRKLFPQFEYNDIYWGLEVAALGAIPDNYKWIASVFGMGGDVKKGVGYIERFIKTHNSNDLLYREAVVFYAYLKFYLLYQQEGAWAYINSYDFTTEGNLLNTFVKANIAVNYRKADVCLDVLESAQQSADYSRYPILDYEYASALLFKVNLNSIGYFKKFLSRYKGGFFVKETWQKIAYAQYISGNMAEATASRQKILTAGSTIVDADKQALRFANNKTWPDRALLEIHLLIDGGYYKTALERIGRKSESDFDNISDKLEYNFRYARIHDELGNDAKAIQYYQSVINLGKQRQEHFAARSALQMAFIYEKAGKISEALARYKECLGMRDHDFQNSIDQQAKAGINRLQ